MSEAKIMISIHAPREGSDYSDYIEATRGYLFQSTLPVKGATFEADGMMIYVPKFQSTLPVKGATAIGGKSNGIIGISIHAPCEGSDIKANMLL